MDITSVKNKISIAIPCFNEAENIPLLYSELTKIFKNELSNYNYEILFVDNKSKDGSRDVIRHLCEKDKHVKAIFNLINCGSNANAIFSLKESDGDCTILLYADFQEPPQLIPKMVKEWENGNKVVCMIKKSSKENICMFFFRKIYYYIAKKISFIPMISQFTGFGLYDKSFVNVIRSVNDSLPFVKGLISEYAYEHVDIFYEQQNRKYGKRSLNLYGYYDAAMMGFTSYSKVGARVVVFLGLIVSCLSFFVGMIYFVLKLIYWERFSAGSIPILLCVLLLGGVQLLFMGFIWEYIISINIRVMNHPLIVEEERINFHDIEVKNTK